MVEKVSNSDANGMYSKGGEFFAEKYILTDILNFSGAIFTSGVTHVGFGVSTQLHISEIRHFITRSAKFIYVFTVLRFLSKSVL